MVKGQRYESKSGRRSTILFKVLYFEQMSDTKGRRIKKSLTREEASFYSVAETLVLPSEATRP